jgi:hypothetical protein
VLFTEVGFVKVIIAGSRSITEFETVKAAIEASGFTISEVVSGAAKGVDRLGEQYAAEHGISVKQFKPDWARNKRGGGLVRNKDMAEYADAAVIVWDGESKGAKHMADTMQQLGKPVYLHTLTGLLDDMEKP